MRARARRAATVVARLKAGAAQLGEEAAHVRGPRTAARYVGWLARRARPALARVDARGAWPAAGAVALRLPEPAGGLVDARRDNPVGWTANVENRVAALGPPALLPRTARTRARRVAADDRAALRRAHHVLDVAAFHPHPAARAATLARLAASGVPVHVQDDDPALAGHLGGDLHGLMRDGVPRGIDDREAASIRMRRLALARHAVTRRPSVSVLLATRRPARLARAVAGVAAQAYPRLELVLALHGDGFGAVPRSPGLPVRIVRVDACRPLGAVLAAAAAAASGELLAKMDDDDCYAPEHLLDLVLAHAYSGAVLVGKGLEVVYLARADRTVRRGRFRAERYSCDIAGGGLLIARRDLRDLGGWRPLPGGVDQALAADVAAAGGAVYRTHGAGFVHVRHGRRHAWGVAEAELLAGADRVRRGWRPELAGIAGAPCPAH